MVKLCTAVRSHDLNPILCYNNNTVVEVCDGCFLSCTSFRIVRFGLSPQLERICAATLYHTGIESYSIPVLLCRVRSVVIFDEVFFALHLENHQGLSVSVCGHSLLRLLSPCLFQTVWLNWVKCVFVFAEAFEVSSLVDHLILNEFAIWHAIRQALSPFPFQTVLLNWARSAFLSAQAFDVLSLEHHLT